jgi:parvulin-like peptidyl-prolyl isomerase
MVRNAENTYQMAQYFGQDPSMAQNFVQQLQQVQAQLNPTVMGNQVMDTMVDDVLIRQEAKKRGITVTDAEVEQAFQAAFGFYPDGTPTPSATTELIPTSTFSALQLTLIPPTPTETVTPTLTLTATLTPTLTLAPGITASAPADLPPATETPTPSSTSSPTPVLSPTATNTPTPFTTEGYATLIADTFTKLQEDYGIEQKTLRYVIESQLYRQKVIDEVVGDVPATEEQVWAEHILVDDEALAKDIYNRLQEGEDWTLMAGTYSTDDSNKTNSGDLGWFGRGQMVKEFEDAAFAAEIGETTEPVKSDFGWHIIRVLGHDNRPVSTDTYQQNRDQEFQDWLTGVRESGEIEIRDWWVEIVPETPALPNEIIQFILANSQQSEPFPQELP